MRPQLVIANWKMNGSAQFCARMADSLATQVPTDSSRRMVLCPPALYVKQLSDLLSDSVIELGAQNLSQHANGAYTGEHSAEMLQECGCQWVLVGHSERRAYHGETDAEVADKALAALTSGLNTVVCVGETLEQRQANTTKDVIARQLQPVLNCGVEKYSQQFVIAYEPVWAIGTGETASPEQAQDVHRFIRSLLDEVLEDTPILYGGSVKAANASQLFGQADIDGGLIGGASLVAEEFLNIYGALPVGNAG